jgi:hypothetical protein
VADVFVSRSLHGERIEVISAKYVRTAGLYLSV